MIDKKYWKDELKSLSYDELNEIEKANLRLIQSYENR